jgi:PEGA domain-containing protein
MASFQMQASNKLVVLTPVVAFLILSIAFANFASAQAVVETAGTTSVSGSVAASGAATAKAIGAVKIPSVGAASPHLIASSGPPPDETNRKALESTAGKDASKLLLRASPVEAQVWIDGKIVGKTPMLLVLAPGKYQIEMRGSRGQTGKSSLALLPRETRELAVKLDQLYPARVTSVKP